MTPMVSRFSPSKALIMGANKNYSRGVNLELRLGTDGHEEGREHSDSRLHSCLNFGGRRRAKFVAREVSGRATTTGEGRRERLPAGAGNRTSWNLLRSPVPVMGMETRKQEQSNDADRP